MRLFIFKTVTFRKGTMKLLSHGGCSSVNWMNELSSYPGAWAAEYRSPRKPASRVCRDPGALSPVPAQLLFTELHLQVLPVLLPVSSQTPSELGQHPGRTCFVRGPEKRGCCAHCTHTWGPRGDSGEQCRTYCIKIRDLGVSEVLFLLASKVLH